MTDDYSPQLDQPLRSRERAALDLAITELLANVRALKSMGHINHARLIQQTIEKIEALLPGSTK